MENLQAQELRIGNYIQNSHGFISKVGIVMIGGKYDYQPIPLTEEWLMKFGFKERSGFNFYVNVWGLKGFMVSLDEYVNIHLDSVYDVFDNNYESIRCYEELHVHQLQNLYFALTGKELTTHHE